MFLINHTVQFDSKQACDSYKQQHSRLPINLTKYWCAVCYDFIHTYLIILIKPKNATFVISIIVSALKPHYRPIYLLGGFLNRWIPDKFLDLTKIMVDVSIVPLGFQGSGCDPIHLGISSLKHTSQLLFVIFSDLPSDVKANNQKDAHTDGWADMTIEMVT